MEKLFRQQLTVAESRANEAPPLLRKHATEEPPDRAMLTLGDSAIALWVKGCAEPLAVLP